MNYKVDVVSGYTDCRQARIASERPGTEMITWCRLVSSLLMSVALCFAFSSLTQLLVNESQPANSCFLKCLLPGLTMWL